VALVTWLLQSPVSSRLAAQTVSQEASIEIDASEPGSKLSPLLYGQFLEFMFQGIKGGLQAELIQNRSFDEAPNAIGLPRYWERYPDDRNDDPAIEFFSDHSTAYPERAGREMELGRHCLRIKARRGSITRHGIYQGQIPVRKDVGYRGYLWLKTTGYEGRILVALESQVEGRGVYAETSIGPIKDGWRQYEFQLQAKVDDPLARIAILFSGRGQVWVDQVSLLPADSVDSIRRDVFERVRALHPAFIRWPGGNVAQDYHWRWGVGPRDQRTSWTNLSWRNESEPSDFGTDEYLRFCQRVGAQPSITVNVEGRGATAREAADWVEYCNGPVSSPQGAVRAANGHPEPYGVQLWEIGNEIWGSWVRGHSDAETYARNLERYQAAMRAVDPKIVLIAVGHNDMDWNRTILERAGNLIDCLSIHHYYGLEEMAGDARNLMARPHYYEAFYQEVAKLIQQTVPRRSIKLAINEWGLSLPVERQYSMEAALYGARLMNVFERTADLVTMTSVSDLINGWPGGIIQANRYGTFVSPIYLVNQLYADHLGAERLRVKVQSPVFESSREGNGVAYLDVAASWSTDRKAIFIKAVNTNQQQAITTLIKVSGVSIKAQASMASVQESSAHAFNSFATPDAISIKKTEITVGETLAIELPRNSVSVIVLQVRPSLN
jgi:alpha-N-arabinofuranosidase